MNEAFDICYKIHAIATLLDAGSVDGDENRIIEAWKTGNNLSNTISHTAGIIKNLNRRMLNILEEIETKQDAIEKEAHALGGYYPHCQCQKGTIKKVAGDTATQAAEATE